MDWPNIWIGTWLMSTGALIGTVLIRLMRLVGVLPTPPPRYPEEVMDAIDAREKVKDALEPPVPGKRPPTPPEGAWVRARGQEIRVIAAGDDGTITVWLQGERKPEQIRVEEVEEVLPERVLGTA